MARKARKKGTVGVIGLGIMGGSFARNLVQSGWCVVGFDRNWAYNPGCRMARP